MKLIKKNSIYLLIMIIFISIFINLYRSSSIKVGDIILHKPSPYRLISIPTKITNSKYELFKHYIGLNTYFKFESGSLIYLNFQHAFSDNKVNIMLRYKKIFSNLEMELLKNNMKNIFYEKKCIYEFTTIENDINTIKGFNKNKNISFSITANSKDIAFQLKDDICR